MTPVLRIGDPVQVHEETEVLTVVCIDCGRAWVRDDVGNHFDYPEVDLHPPLRRVETPDQYQRRRQFECKAHVWMP